MTAKTLPRGRSLMSIRRWLQAAAVLGTLLIGVRHILPGDAAGAFDAFCPFGGVETLIHYLNTGQTLRSTNLLNFSILLGVAGVSLLAGRAFCGWLCPLGALQDGLARMARRLSGEKRHVRGKLSRTRFPLTFTPRVDRWLRGAKYLLLAVVLLVSASALFPPLRDICPVRAVFGFTLTTPLLWGVLLSFVLTSMLVERFWCKYLCPLGALLAISNKFAPLRLVVDPACCNDCGRCDTECPMEIPLAHANTRHSECIRCLECLETCTRKETIMLKLG